MRTATAFFAGLLFGAFVWHHLADQKYQRFVEMHADPTHECKRYDQPYMGGHWSFVDGVPVWELDN